MANGVIEEEKIKLKERKMLEDTIKWEQMGQILLGPLLNTLSQISREVKKIDYNFVDLSICST